MTLVEHMPSQHGSVTDGDSWPVRLMPGPRWFSTGDPVHRLFTDPSAATGELTGVVLESMVPSAAGMISAVDCADDVWQAVARLHSYNQVIVRGTIDDAMVTIANRHDERASIQGRDESGAYFWGGDRDLTRWSLQSRLWAMLAANQAYAPEPLSLAEADQAVALWARVMRLAGVPDPAASFADLNSYLRGMAPLLSRTEVATGFLAQLESAEPATEADTMCSAAALALLPTAARRVLGLSGGRETRIPVAAYARQGRMSMFTGDVPAPIGPPSALRLTRQFR